MCRCHAFRLAAVYFLRGWFPDVRRNRLNSLLALGVNAHDPNTGSVDSGRVRPMTIRPACRGVPMIGPSPSMPTIPSTIAELRSDRRADVEDRVVDPGVVQHVLRPAVSEDPASRRRGSSSTGSRRPSGGSSSWASRRSRSAWRSVRGSVSLRGGEPM